MSPQGDHDRERERDALRHSEDDRERERPSSHDAMDAHREAHRTKEAVSDRCRERRRDAADGVDPGRATPLGSSKRMRTQDDQDGQAGGGDPVADLVEDLRRAVARCRSVDDYCNRAKADAAHAERQRQREANAAREERSRFQDLQRKYDELQRRHEEQGHCVAGKVVSAGGDDPAHLRRRAEEAERQADALRRQLEDREANALLAGIAGTRAEQRIKELVKGRNQARDQLSEVRQALADEVERVRRRDATIERLKADMERARGELQQLTDELKERTEELEQAEACTFQQLCDETGERLRDRAPSALVILANDARVHDPHFAELFDYCTPLRDAHAVLAAALDAAAAAPFADTAAAAQTIKLGLWGAHVMALGKHFERYDLVEERIICTAPFASMTSEEAKHLCEHFFAMTHPDRSPEHAQGRALEKALVLLRRGLELLLTEGCAAMEPGEYQHAQQQRHEVGGDDGEGGEEENQDVGILGEILQDGAA